MRASSTPSSTWASTVSRPISANESRPTVAYFDGSDPERHAQLLPVSVQPDGLRTAREAAGQGRGRGVRPLGDRRDPAVPGPLGRGLLIDLRVDGRKSPWRALARLSGFGFWSHDIGGFEGTPPASVFKRWIAFGLLSSHSRLHANESYRVPWLFDEEAVEVMRTFTSSRTA